VPAWLRTATCRTEFEVGLVTTAEPRYWRASECSVVSFSLGFFAFLTLSKRQPGFSNTTISSSPSGFLATPSYRLSSSHFGSILESPLSAAICRAQVPTFAKWPPTLKVAAGEPAGDANTKSSLETFRFQRVYIHSIYNLQYMALILDHAIYRGSDLTCRLQLAFLWYMN
jgi:hypothetical protein